MIAADLSNMGEYMAVVGGMLKAMEDPRFKGNFVEHISTKIEKHFMTETIAAHMSGQYNLKHVFEWGPQDSRGVATGEPGKIPLFRLRDSGLRNTKMLTFEFLPSVKPVPLPDPEVYGFSPDKISHMNRHTFQLKALIMETQSNVAISPVGATKLFIPTKKSKYGYVMTPKTVITNPGGRSSTGAFSSWWTLWFETRAPQITKAEANLTEQMVAATGRKLIRYAANTKIGGVNVGGRFAAAKGRSLAFVQPKSEQVKAEFMAISEAYFDEEKWERTW